ncbi:2-hydroxy-3-oxopropionate reductase [Pseudovibrio sp. Ad13]|uniref:NAD(P)-dependent oxidoreductase n=1 Tax=Pseudovibrio sp. Ad13 TaxID=989396 RepID=UPI0007AE421F|nr:NAD(P)-dependent oxidoreductase [Pseudovibrio sp. Ad13]KZK80523.1 2-hydroxy-3-oxopropionate reductase [Pseudovibrio sp. Ad13]
MTIGFIGLGAMGLGMAQRINKNHALKVYNRSPEKAADLVAEGAQQATSLQDFADCHIVCSMLSDDAAVEAVYLAGDTLALPLKENSISISHSTISPPMVDRLTAAHERANVRFLCVPVLGRPDKAAEGQLVAVAAGERSTMDEARSVLEAISTRQFWMGPTPRQAAVTKLGMNFMIAAAVEALAESFTLTRKAGIDPETFLTLITETLFSAPVYQAYAPLIAREQNPSPGFKTSLGLKDVNLAQQTAQDLKVPLPTADVVANQLRTAIAAGYADEDWSILARLMAQTASLPPIKP